MFINIGNLCFQLLKNGFDSTNITFQIEDAFASTFYVDENESLMLREALDAETSPPIFKLTIFAISSYTGAIQVQSNITVILEVCLTKLNTICNKLYVVSS